MELGEEKIYQKTYFTCMKCGYKTSHNQNYTKHINAKLNPCKKYKNGIKINLSY